MRFLNISLKPSLFLLALCMWMGSYAQEKKTMSDAEIVMTTTELQSFIQRVASLKKERIEKEQKEKIISELEQAVSRELARKQATPPRIIQGPPTTVTTQQALSEISPQDYRSNKSDIEELNARMDLLMRMMETMRLQLDEAEYRREVLSRSGDLPRENRLTSDSNDPNYLVAPDYNVTSAYPQTQQTYKSRSVVEPYRDDIPHVSPIDAEQQRATSPVQAQEVIPPDTIYVVQDEAGYETVVSPGVSKLQPKGGRQTSVASGRDVRKSQTTQQERVRVVQAPPQTIYLDRGRNKTQQPVIIYRDQRDNPPVHQVDASDSATMSAQQQQLETKKKIDALETEISLLRELMSGSEKNEEQKYIDDINRLKMQISALTSELETKKAKEADAAKRTEEESVEKDSVAVRNDAPKGQPIYFANNSVEIPINDYVRLKEIASQIKNNSELLVLLRGFASSVGNAAYNQKIAGERAASVQKWLVQNGVAPNKIITQGQGIDTSKQEDKARRVEITVLSK